MATLKFILRPSTKPGRHQGCLSLRVIQNRSAKTVSICRHLFSEEWDQEAQAILYPTDDPQRLAYLTEIDAHRAVCIRKMSEVIRNLEERKPYTTSEVIECYHRTTDDSKLTGYAAMLSAELTAKGQFRTAKAYTTVCRGLIAFNSGIDIPLEQINATLIKRFETHLKERSKQPNTISYYMRNLRAIYNKAVAATRIAKDEKPFAGVFTGVEETRKRALSSDEVNRIKSIDFDKLLQEHDPDSRQGCYIRQLHRAQRLFLFCLYAQGMCFVDLCYLKKENLKGGVIRYYRKKTGKQINVPLNDGMTGIIKDFEEEMRDSEHMFPLLDNGKDNLRLQYETALRAQNRRLKEVAALAKLDKGITTHVARHSWASIMKNKMQPISVINEGLGHSSEKMTRKYLTSMDYSILAKAGRTVLAAVSRPSPSTPF